jgi:hypothetical protein
MTEERVRLLGAGALSDKLMIARNKNGFFAFGQYNNSDGAVTNVGFNGVSIVEKGTPHGTMLPDIGILTLGDLRWGLISMKAPWKMNTELQKLCDQIVNRDRKKSLIATLVQLSNPLYPDLGWRYFANSITGGPQNPSHMLENPFSISEHRLEMQSQTAINESEIKNCAQNTNGVYRNGIHSEANNFSKGSPKTTTVLPLITASDQPPLQQFSWDYEIGGNALERHSGRYRDCWNERRAKIRAKIRRAKRRGPDEEDTDAWDSVGSLDVELCKIQTFGVRPRRRRIRDPDFLGPWSETPFLYEYSDGDDCPENGVDPTGYVRRRRRYDKADTALPLSAFRRDEYVVDSVFPSRRFEIQISDDALTSLDNTLEPEINPDVELNIVQPSLDAHNIADTNLATDKGVYDTLLMGAKGLTYQDTQNVSDHPIIKKEDIHVNSGAQIATDIDVYGKDTYEKIRKEEKRNFCPVCFKNVNFLGYQVSRLDFF